MENLNEIIFWTGYWTDKILPIINFCLAIAFHSIIINRVYRLVIHYYDNLIDLTESVVDM